ncbi:hypothetical protein K492DRAFT_209225 [Lichtheimia hyalospora FSU 10163]|nr:hypothetical protein K492DRAFT_209225 [Lichtheimia hyalospora FSU 10163]
MNPNYPSLWSHPQPSADPLKPAIDPAPPYESRPNSLADLGVADILERYQHDTELLKHILMAKAEEDKRRAAEEIRLAEEARLQAKYLDLLEGTSQHSRRTSDLIEGFDALGNNEAPQAWFNNGSNLPMMSQHMDKTPPSPSPTNFMPPPSPYTMFDVPFEQLTISSSPEPSKQKPSSQRNSLNVPTITTNNNNNNAATTNTHTDSLTPPSPPPPPPHAAPRERPCKRTLSRTRSQRKGPPKTSTNKRNKRVSQQQQLSDDEQQQPSQSQQQQQQQRQQQQQPTAPEEPQLDHGKVMEALRAKLQRSAALQPHQQQQLKQEQQDQTPNSMSPTGILLLDLKNPNRKSFPTRKPHVAAVRRPRPFASAHNYCESSVKKEQG